MQFNVVNRLLSRFFFHVVEHYFEQPKDELLTWFLRLSVILLCLAVHKIQFAVKGKKKKTHTYNAF
jgi:hypothetical protein